MKKKVFKTEKEWFKMKGEIKEIIFRNLILMKYKIQEYLEFYEKISRIDTIKF